MGKTICEDGVEMRLFFIALTLFLVSGCSAVLTEEYHSPSGDFGVNERVSWQFHPVATTGKGEVFVFERENIGFELKSNNYQSRMRSIGPLIFPIIPVPDLDEKRKFENYEIEVHFYNKDKTVQIEKDNFFLTLQGTSEEIPLKVEYVSLPDGANRLLLFGPSDLEEVEGFYLHMDGIVINGRKLEIPAIQFEKTKGFVIAFGP